MSALTPKKRQPPPKTAKRQANEETNLWKMLLAPLMERKNIGEWFEVRTYPTNGAANTAAYDIRNGRNRYVPEGEWDATARSGVLFVKYIGKKIND